MQPVMERLDLSQPEEVLLRKVAPRLARTRTAANGTGTVVERNEPKYVPRDRARPFGVPGIRLRFCLQASKPAVLVPAPQPTVVAVVPAAGPVPSASPDSGPSPVALADTGVPGLTLAAAGAGAVLLLGGALLLVVRRRARR